MFWQNLPKILVMPFLVFLSTPMNPVWASVIPLDSGPLSLLAHSSSPSIRCPHTRLCPSPGSLMASGQSLTAHLPTRSHKPSVHCSLCHKPQSHKLLSFPEWPGLSFATRHLHMLVQVRNTLLPHHDIYTVLPLPGRLL